MKARDEHGRLFDVTPVTVPNAPPPLGSSSGSANDSERVAGQPEVRSGGREPTGTGAAALVRGWSRIGRAEWWEEFVMGMVLFAGGAVFGLLISDLGGGKRSDDGDEPAPAEQVAPELGSSPQPQPEAERSANATVEPCRGSRNESNTGR